MKRERILYSAKLESKQDCLASGNHARSTGSRNPDARDDHRHCWAKVLRHHAEDMGADIPPLVLDVAKYK